MNERRLDAIKARMNDATPGDWSIDLSGEFSVIMDASNFLTLDYGSVLDGINNANFIANARQDVSDLLGEVKRLRETLEFYANEEHYDTPPDAGLDLYCAVTDDHGCRARRALNGGSQTQNHRVSYSDIDSISPEVIIVSCANCNTLLSVGRNADNRKRKHYCSSGCKGEYLSAKGGDR